MMNKKRNIYSLATLEKEIALCRQEANEKERQLKSNMIGFKKDFGKLIINSLFCNGQKNTEKKGDQQAAEPDNNWKRSAMETILNRVSGQWLKKTEDFISSRFSK